MTPRMELPDFYGYRVTEKNHKKAEGPTDPENIKLPDDFTVVVTGAGHGIGYYIATSFAKAGAANIIIGSRKRDELEKLEEDLKKINPKIKVLGRPLDVMEEADVERLAGETKQNFETLDVVVSNAGIISKYITDDDGSNPKMPVGGMEDKDFERVIKTNVIGSHLVAKHFLPLLASSHRGPQALVVTTSVASHCEDSSITPIAYNLSKIAMNRMVENISNDHLEKDGIQAFAVHPGGVVTAQTEKHNTTQRGEWWDAALGDDINLMGGFCTWLTKERREWLSGRYLSATWDVEELESKKDEIIKGDKLKMRLVV